MNERITDCNSDLVLSHFSSQLFKAYEKFESISMQTINQMKDFVFFIHFLAINT